MKKSDIFTTIKTQNLEWHWLFRFTIIVSLSVSSLNVNAQCPTATAMPITATICSGSTTSLSFKSDQIGTTYTWIVAQVGVVGATDGTNSRIAQTLTTTDAATGSVVYTITPLANACKGKPISVIISVNPIPVITATPLTSTIASNNPASIALTSDVADTKFSWTVIQSGLTGAKIGSGNVIDQILTTNAEKGIATYNITPNLKGCAGEPINAKVIVKSKS